MHTSLLILICSINQSPLEKQYLNPSKTNMRPFTYSYSDTNSFVFESYALTSSSITIIWKIEDCFRLMKTDFKSRRVYHYKDKRIESHFLICFLALLIFRLLHVKLGDKYTSNELLITLREMEYYKYEEGYLTPFATTPLVSDLNEMFDMKASRQ